MILNGATAAASALGAVPEVVNAAKPIITKARVIIAASVVACTTLGVYLYKRAGKKATEAPVAQPAGPAVDEQGNPLR